MAKDKIIQRIIELAKHDSDICILWLYGSRAEGTATEHSDYDLAVAFNNFDLPPFDRLTRPHSLAAGWRSTLNLPERMLSVTDINQCPVPLAINVIEANSALVIKDDLRFSLELSRVWALWSEIDHNSKQQDRFAI